MKLKNLIKDLELTVKGSKEIEITGISADSRTVAPGNLFFAKRGTSYDGTQFIDQALNAGAVAIATDIYDPFCTQTQIIHPNLREIEPKIAARYYDHPSKELFVVGVTGTKGKTTTTYLVKHLLDGLGKPCGLIGTVETILGSNRFFSTLTTHESIANQKYLREMVIKGCKAAALEVSSHGLDQGRVEEIGFDLAIFTNLYPDHLDYHKTMEEYAQAKAKLFKQSKRAILNADSPWSSSMGSGFTFGIEKKADLIASEISFTTNGTKFLANYQGKECLFTSPLIGRYNVSNLLGAIATGLYLGAELEQIRDILAQFPSVPGRLERVGHVFIDFAHNGESLAHVLQTLKEVSSKRVIVVFGCGGNRSAERREGMAKAAEKWADISIVTSDNPRSEDPHEIIKQIVSGFKIAPIQEIDRKKAIHLAIEMAHRDDIVLIAGRGHEREQIVGSEKIPFSDIEVAKEALQKIGRYEMLDSN